MLRSIKATFLFIICLFAALPASAQEDAGTAGASAEKPAPTKFLPNELESLCAPIALYPDVLLAQMLPAATFPDQIVDAGLLIRTKEDAKLISEQSWDASVKAIAYYPGVLKMMFEKLDWTKSIGDAFLIQHQELLDAIQRLRAKAKQFGNLESNEQQKVAQQTTAEGKQIITVAPADPQVIYVPQESTTVVYTEPAKSTADDLMPLVTFGLGMAVGSAMSDDDDDDYHGHYWGPGGVWVSDDAYDDWHEQREDVINNWQDQQKDRQNFRQDQRTQRQDFRQDMIKDNPEQARQYYDQRKQQVQERRSSQGEAASQRRAEAKSNLESSQGSGNFSRAKSEMATRQQQAKSSGGSWDSFSDARGNRPTQYDANRQQQLATARQDMQNRQRQSQYSGQYGSSRGYSSAAPARGNWSNSSAFNGMNSGNRASAYSSRGASSRSRAGMSSGGARSYSGGGGRSFSGGGMRGGGGGRRR